jgi:quercetin 2,3-dioxygenase
MRSEGDGWEAMQEIAPRTVDLGGLTVRRLLPRAVRRLIGPWCFLDLVGPMSIAATGRMGVPPHPHIGLQTVTWLLEGEILHRDSLGSEAVARPGTLNLMTAGRGIAHSEETPLQNSGRLHAIQLWVALPDAHRHVEPAFDEYAERPVVERGGSRLHVILGQVAGTSAPGRTFWPMMAVEATLEPGAVELPLEAAFEHGVVPLMGQCELGGERLVPDSLYYQAPGSTGLSLRVGSAGARVLLIGGAPFGETILMWWNFVARTTEEIVAAREDWQARRRFAEVRGYPGERLEAPPFLSRPVPPNPMS